MPCLAGMGFGLLIDMLSSPTGSIPSICASGGSLAGRMAMHWTLMPAAHAGMLIGVVICVLARGPAGPARVTLLLLWQLLCIILAEVSILLPGSPAANPVLAMAGMAILMALANLPIVERTVASAIRMKAIVPSTWVGQFGRL